MEIYTGNFLFFLYVYKFIIYQFVYPEICVILYHYYALILIFSNTVIHLCPLFYRDLSREQAERKKLQNDLEDIKGNVRVFVRIRPFSNRELERGTGESVIRVNLTHITKIVQ